MDGSRLESDKVEEEVARVFAESQRSGETSNEREVQVILARAQRQVVIRDLVTFSLVRVWTTFLSVTIGMCALFRPQNEKEHLPGDEHR
jgi:hypothetical protein